MIMKMDFIGSCSFARVILQKNEMVTTIASGYPFTTANILIQPSLKAELMLVYFPALHYSKNLNKTLQQWLSKSFFKGTQGPFWGWWGRNGGVWNRGTMFSHFTKQSTPMLVKGSFMRTFVIVPNVLIKFSKIGSVFFFRCSV